MGRRKITIKQITDAKLRHITFNKRKNGLIKKAAELSLLCNVNMLLIFEDGNGNLIQFSKNKIANINGFFQECRYSNLLEFNAKDYPNFFKVNHYKKHKDKEDDIDNYELGDDDSSSDTITHNQTKLSKRKEPSGGFSKNKDDENNKIIYQSGSEDSSNEGNDDLTPYQEAHHTQQQKNQINIVKPKTRNPAEKQKVVTMQEDETAATINEQESVSSQKESFQSYKDVASRIRADKPLEFTQQFMAFETPFKRNPVSDPTTSRLSFYPSDNNSINLSTTTPPTFGHAPTYSNNPYVQNPYQQAQNNLNMKNNRMRGFGALNMGNIADEGALSAMLKGFSPLGFALGGGNPYLNKPSTKQEMEDKILDTTMNKYLNGTGIANAAYIGQKMYGFYPPEVSKPEENEVIANLRNQNEHEGVTFDHAHDYPELSQYIRADYANFPSNIPNNLPSAYFSSKKFNFEGNYNNFEDDRFKEMSDPKKKHKQ